MGEPQSTQPRIVTIVYDQDGTITAVPFVVHIFPTNQAIQWNLVTQVPGVTWAAEKPGIVLHTNPPAPYHPWTGAPAAPCGDSYCADAASPNTGPTPYKYSYDVNLDVPDGSGGVVTLTLSGSGTKALHSDLMKSYDPDISNDPPRP